MFYLVLKSVGQKELETKLVVMSLGETAGSSLSLSPDRMIKGRGKSLWTVESLRRNKDRCKNNHGQNFQPRYGKTKI